MTVFGNTDDHWLYCTRTHTSTSCFHKDLELFWGPENTHTAHNQYTPADHTQSEQQEVINGHGFYSKKPLLVSGQSFNADVSCPESSGQTGSTIW